MGLPGVVCGRLVVFHIEFLRLDSNALFIDGAVLFRSILWLVATLKLVIWPLAILFHLMYLVKLRMGWSHASEVLARMLGTLYWAQQRAI